MNCLVNCLNWNNCILHPHYIFNQPRYNLPRRVSSCSCQHMMFSFQLVLTSPIFIIAIKIFSCFSSCFSCLFPFDSYLYSCHEMCTLVVVMFNELSSNSFSSLCCGFKTTNEKLLLQLYAIKLRGKILFIVSREVARVSYKK